MTEPLALLDDVEPVPGFEELTRVLAALDRAAGFCVGGVEVGPTPAIDVDGFGPLPLPLIRLVVAALREVSTPAPYGRGGDTLVDPEVRRCRQIAAADVRLVGPAWASLLADIVARAAAGLGLEGEVTAHLYKLLLYEPGDFFLPHRDSEKEDGMAATLVVALPGAYSGGELIVRHGEEERTVPLRSGCRDGLAWAAFYADCLHEVRPLTDGARAVLVFNLVRREGTLTPLKLDATVEDLRRPLEAWCGSDDAPPKLCYLLSHRYSAAELSWERLKGADQARAEALARAAGLLDMTVALGMVRIEETWSAQSLGWRGSREPEVDPTQVELYDYIDGSIRVEDLVERAGRPLGEVALKLVEAEVAPPGALRDELPDEVHYHEATGNEGATAERTYRRAAVVLWPASRLLEVMSQGGADGLIQAMGDPGLDEVQVEELALRAAGLLWGPSDRRHGRLLDAIAARVSAGGLGSWVRLQVEHGWVAPDCAAPLGRALGFLDDVEAGDNVADVMEHTTWHALWDNASTLDALRESCRHPATFLAPALDHLISCLAAGPQPPRFGIHRPRSPSIRQLSALLRVTVHAAPARSAELLDLVQDWPRVIGFDAVVVPTVVAICRELPGHPALEGWVGHVRAVLGPRVAAPPEPPLDLRRRPPTDCSCEDCRVLGSFLVDPARDRVDLKRNQGRRSHLCQVIDDEALDVATETIRRGSPYTLRCVKTLRSYEAEVVRHRLDLQHLDSLGRSWPPDGTP